jgi:hypothetical protein
MEACMNKEEQMQLLTDIRNKYPLTQHEREAIAWSYAACLLKIDLQSRFDSIFSEENSSA